MFSSLDKLGKTWLFASQDFVPAYEKVNAWFRDTVLSLTAVVGALSNSDVSVVLIGSLNSIVGKRLEESVKGFKYRLKY